MTNPTGTASGQTAVNSSPPPSQGEDSRITAALGHLRAMLVAGETLEAYAVQRRSYALTRRRMLVAATSGRFIVMERGLFGGFTPTDMRWQDLEDVHIRVGVLGADLVARAMQREDLASADGSVRVLGAAGLRKDQAESVYRVCQAQSQSWREKRRIRDLDELRAKSGGVQFGASPMSGVAAPGDGGAGDPVARLQRAKEMLAGGLITDAEFESIKAKIIDRM